MIRSALGVLLALNPAFAGDDPGSVGGSAARIFFLDIRGGRVLSANPDGSDLKVNRRSEGSIGIALDLKGGRMFFTDLGGNVHSAKLDGSQKKVLRSGQGSLTGIAVAELGK